MIHPQFVHHPHLGIPGFMAVFTHLTVSARLGWPTQTIHDGRWNPWCLQIFKELLLLLEVPRKILRLLTTNLNQLVINLEVRVSCNICFLFMGHGSSCICTAGTRSGSNSFVKSMSFRQLSLSLLPKWSCDLYPPCTPPRWTPSRQRATLRFWY